MWLRSAFVLLLSLGLSDVDVSKVRRLNDDYVDGWRRNDRAAIVALFRDDAVIVPQGRNAIEGIRAIEAFWWPQGGGRTVITKFEHTTDEVGGSGDFAFARGTFAFDFTYDGAKLSNAGTYLMLFARDAKGEWKITHRMWSDRKR